MNEFKFFYFVGRYVYVCMCNNTKQFMTIIYFQNKKEEKNPFCGCVSNVNRIIITRLRLPIIYIYILWVFWLFIYIYGLWMQFLLIVIHLFIYVVSCVPVCVCLYVLFWFHSLFFIFSQFVFRSSFVV